MSVILIEEQYMFSCEILTNKFSAIDNCVADKVLMMGLL